MARYDAYDRNRDWKREVFVPPHACQRIRERCGGSPSISDRAYKPLIARSVMATKDELTEKGFDVFNSSEMREVYPSLRMHDNSEYLFTAIWPASVGNGHSEDAYIVVYRQSEGSPEFRNQLVVKTIYSKEMYEESIDSTAVAESALNDMKKQCITLLTKEDRSIAKMLSDHLSSSLNGYLFVVLSENDKLQRIVPCSSDPSDIHKTLEDLLLEGIDMKRVYALKRMNVALSFQIESVS